MCKICHHPELQLINDMIFEAEFNGAKLRAISDKFPEVSPANVTYHKKHLVTKNFKNNLSRQQEEFEKKHIDWYTFLTAVIEKAYINVEEASVRDGVTAARTMLEHERQSGSPSQTAIMVNIPQPPKEFSNASRRKLTTADIVED